MANKAKITVDFNEADKREELKSGELINTLFGKIKRWFTDLKSVAFTGKYSDLTDAPTVITGGSQTTSSTDPGGKNVFTFDLSDGKTRDVVVYNGTQGPQGAQGPKGDTGAQGPKGDTGAAGKDGTDGLTTSVTFAGTKYSQSGGNITIADTAVQKAVTPTTPKSGQIAVYDGTAGKQKGIDVLPLSNGGTGQTGMKTLTAADDLDEITVPGVYLINSNNAPAHYPYPDKLTGILEVIGDFVSKDSKKIQRLTLYGSAGKCVERTLVNSLYGWTEWSKLLVMDDIVWLTNVGKLLYWDGSFVKYSDITNTELGCLSGVKSNIQAQLDSALPDGKAMVVVQGKTTASGSVTIPYQSGYSKALIEIWRQAAYSPSATTQFNYTAYGSVVASVASSMTVVIGTKIVSGPSFTGTYAISTVGDITVYGIEAFEYRVTFFN